MSILAAPLQSLGVIGTQRVSPNQTIPRTLTPLQGFVLLGIPVYYITQKSEDTPRVFGAYKSQVGSIQADGRDFSSDSRLLWSIQKQTGCWFWMAGRCDRRGGNGPTSSIGRQPRPSTIMSESSWSNAHLILAFSFSTPSLDYQTSTPSTHTWSLRANSFVASGGPVLPPQSEIYPQTVACYVNARLKSVVCRSDLGQISKTFLHGNHEHNINFHVARSELESTRIGFGCFLVERIARTYLGSGGFVTRLRA